MYLKNLNDVYFILLLLLSLKVWKVVNFLGPLLTFNPCGKGEGVGVG